VKNLHGSTLHVSGYSFQGPERVMGM
jgi:hypothetical protein